MVLATRRHRARGHRGESAVTRRALHRIDHDTRPHHVSVRQHGAALREHDIHVDLQQPKSVVDAFAELALQHRRIHVENASGSVQEGDSDAAFAHATGSNIGVSARRPRRGLHITFEHRALRGKRQRRRIPRPGKGIHVCWHGGVWHLHTETALPATPTLTDVAGVGIHTVKIPR